MPRSKPTTHKGPGGMIPCQQLATRDASFPRILAPEAPTEVTADNVTRNKECKPACAAAAVVLRGITNPVNPDVLKDALGKAFVALDGTD